MIASHVRLAQRPQQGFLLVIALALLLSLTVLGIAALKERDSWPLVASERAARQLAFEAAETALRAGEAWLAEPSHRARADRNEPLADPAGWDGRNPIPTGTAAACRHCRSLSPPAFYVGPPQLARLGLELPARYRRIYPVTARASAARGEDAGGTMTAVLRSMFEPVAPSPRGCGDPTDSPASFADGDSGSPCPPRGVVQLCNGVSAAVFGNATDSERDRAMLVVADAESGALIQAIDTGVGDTGRPNWLSAPAITDWPAGDQRATRVYAGDLHGNLWRFTLSCRIDGTLSPIAASRLFTAEDSHGARQPIRVRPVIAKNPADSGQIFVVFGTGGAVPQSHRQAQHHSLYGIIDTADPNSSTALSRQDLVAASIVTREPEPLHQNQRQEGIASASQLDSQRHQGWRLDLQLRRRSDVVEPPRLLRGVSRHRVRFAIRMQEWKAGHNIAQGYLLDIDLATGARAAVTVFDLNRDGRLDGHGRVGDLPVSGIGLMSGGRISSSRTQIGRETNPYTEGENGIGALGDAQLGRRSWRQLR